MTFVLDNSVTMRWLMPSIKQEDQHYAKTVLQTFVNSEAIVPNLWHLEVANVLIGAEKRGEIDPSNSEAFISRLETLPINKDEETTSKALNRTLNLARSYQLSSYDAAYLELAIRKSFPIATLDIDLRKVAIRANVELYQVS